MIKNIFFILLIFSSNCFCAEKIKNNYFQKCGRTDKIILEWRHNLYIGEKINSYSVKKWAVKKINNGEVLKCPYCGHVDCILKFKNYIVTTKNLL